MPNKSKKRETESEDQRSEENEDRVNPAPGPVGGAVRREENSISFRHFLQNSSDNGSRPRHPLGSAASVDHIALPDFVQDHLVVESFSGQEHSQASVDLSVLREVLPSDASSCNKEINSNRRLAEQDGARAADSTTTTTLPDFLSDGPMQCNGSNSIDSVQPVSQFVSGRSRGRSSRSFDFESSGIQDISVLRRELAEKNRRVYELETDIALQQSELTRLENELRLKDEELNAAKKRANEAERTVLKLTKQRTQNGEPNQPKASSSSSSTSNITNNERVLMMLSSSETLVSQLLGNLLDLRDMAEPVIPKAPDDDTPKD